MFILIFSKIGQGLQKIIPRFGLLLLPFRHQNAQLIVGAGFGMAVVEFDLNFQSLAVIAL